MGGYINRPWDLCHLQLGDEIPIPDTTHLGLPVRTAEELTADWVVPEGSVWGGIYGSPMECLGVEVPINEATLEKRRRCGGHFQPNRCQSNKQ